MIGEIAKKEGIKVDVAEVEGEMTQLRQQYQVGLPPPPTQNHLQTQSRCHSKTTWNQINLQPNATSKPNTTFNAAFRL